MNVDKIKPWLDIADLAFKLSVAVIGFLLFGVEKQRLDVESTRNKILKDQQELNLVVPDKIITLLFDARNKCIAEDQAFMLDFLIDTSNSYNKVPIDKKEFFRASSARRNCSNGSIAQDAKLSAASHQGNLPILTNAQDVTTSQTVLKTQGVKLEKSLDTVQKASGYLAVGTFSKKDNSFRNFIVPSGSFSTDGAINSNSIIRSRWSVYLRVNNSNTEGGSNPILGVVKENACVQVLKSFPALRGQTWAEVKIVDCPK